MDGRGFTLVELSVALFLLAVFATVAVPGMREFVRDTQQSAAINGLLHAVHTARRLAAASGRRVELCATQDGRDCSGSPYWDGDLLLRTQSAAGVPPRVIPSPSRYGTLSVRANRSAVAFTPLNPAATTATITVCDDRGPRAAAAVIISRAGRPRLSRLDPSGRPLACP